VTSSMMSGVYFVWYALEQCCYGHLFILQSCFYGGIAMAVL